tara:strand:+ start:306 stop:671 length:366 start_codon:yes stop_codon:yes gene_type:complete
MSDSMNTRNFIALDALDAEETQNSAAIFTQQMLYISAHITGGTSVPNGTLKIYGSNEHGISNPGLGTPSLSAWAEIGSLSATAVGQGVSVADLGYRWCRLTWTNSSSTAGNMTVRCTLKGW